MLINLSISVPITDINVLLAVVAVVVISVVVISN
jgi:hypothetical protein